MNAKSEQSCENRLKLPPQRRLRSQIDYARVYARKCRVSDDHLLIYADKCPTGTTRIGLSVSRKNGNSVVRHRVRRLIREAFRLSQHQLPSGIDLICIPRPGSNASVDDYQQSLVNLVQKLAKRLQN